MKRLLFICRENACRSQIAEAFARFYGRGRVLSASAGSTPSREIHPQAVSIMEEIGCNLRGQASKSVADLPPVYFDYVVTMGYGEACPPVTAGRREAWDIPDPKDMDDESFRRVRDLIKTKVLTLIACCT